MQAGAPTQTEQDTRQFYIPTTRKPVRILKIAEEADTSTVCINFSHRQAGVSSGYHSFVKRPTGVIHRLFASEPYPFYRMDVSDGVDAGESWELAVFLAHAQMASGAPGPKDLVWATATVSNDLRVGAVASVSEKIRLSEELFEDAIEDGRQVIVLMSKENQGDLDTEASRVLGRLAILPIFAARVDEALRALGLPSVESAAATKPKSPEPSWTGNPYPGLRPYTRKDRPVFFGRSRAIEEATVRFGEHSVLGRPFLLVHGPSGSGKTSLVNAGLVADLDARGDSPAAVAKVSPGSSTSPSSGLASAVRELLEAAGVAHGDTDDLGHLLRTLETIRTPAADAERQPLVLVVDRLDAVLDPALPDGEREAFDRAIDSIIALGWVRVIAEMRSDAMGSLGSLPCIKKMADAGHAYGISPPTRSEFISITRGPFGLGGKVFGSDEVVDELVDAAFRSSDSLPVLQAALHDLFELAGVGRSLERASFVRMKGFDGAAAKIADGALRRILAGGVAEAELDATLASLVRIDPETRVPMVRERRTDRESSDQAILADLVESRVATTVLTADGPRIRFAHPAFVTNWPKMIEVVADETVALIARDRLAMQARGWMEGTEPLLTPGPIIARAEALLAGNSVSVPPEVGDYVAASRKAASRNGRRRRVLLGGTAAAGLVVLALAGGVAVQQSRIDEAERARAISDAYRDATKADRELRFGSISKAVELASQALSRSKDLPFVPSLYQVLYGAAFGSESRPIEIAVYTPDQAPATGTVALADGVFLSWSPEEIRAWTASRGVISVQRARVAVPASLRVSEDRFTALVETEGGGTLKYSVTGNRWDEPGQGELASVFLSGAPLPSGDVVGCGHSALVRVSVDIAAGGDPASESFPLEGCVKVVAGNGRLYVARVDRATKEAFVSSVDPETLAVLSDYPAIGRRWRGAGISVFGDSIVVAPSVPKAGEGIMVFREGRPDVSIKIDPASERAFFSDDGIWVAWKGAGSGSVAFRRLDTDEEILKTCEGCMPIGFAVDNTFLATKGDGLLRLDPLGRFSDRLEARLKGTPDRAEAFASVGAVVATWGNQTDVHLPVGKAHEGTQGLEEVDLSGLVDLAFLDAGRVVAGIDVPNMRQTDAKLVTLSRGQSVQGWTRRFDGRAYFTALSNGLLAVSLDGSGDHIGTDPGVRPGTGITRLHVVDDATGRDVPDPLIASLRPTGMPKVSDDGRYLVIPTATGLVSFDAVSRTSRQLPGSVAASAAFAVVGDTAVFSTDVATVRVRLDTLESETFGEGRSVFACSSGETLYAFSQDQGGLAMEVRWRDRSGRIAWEKGSVPELLLPLSLAGSGAAGEVDLAEPRPGDIACGSNVLVYAGSVVPAPGPVTLDGIDGLADVPRVPAFDTSVNGRLRFDGPDGARHEFSFDPVRTTATGYMPSNGIVLAGLENGEVLAWKLDADEAPMILVAAHAGPVAQIIGSPSENAFVTLDGRGVARLWPLPPILEVAVAARERAPIGTLPR